MSKTGPLIVIEDDPEDHQIIREVLAEIRFNNPVKFFVHGQEALDYLQSTRENPFLILCDINMPVMNGLQLRSIIDDSPPLRKKSIPFVFFSTTARPGEVSRAYELTVQGFFEKGSNFKQLVKQLELIIQYWQECKHPNSMNS